MGDYRGLVKGNAQYIKTTTGGAYSTFREKGESTDRVIIFYMYFMIDRFYLFNKFNKFNKSFARVICYTHRNNLHTRTAPGGRLCPY
ncbi:hypothetical protein D0T84_00490 [Dysgonomonas sp. 521]|nr:hypothetical protein [Dysgonomonas sp. 521]